MKKIFLILAFLALVSGCAVIKKNVENFKACAKDSTGQCVQESATKAKPIGDTAATIAGLSGIPAAPNVAKPVANYLALIYFMCLFGGKLTEKKEVK